MSKIVSFGEILTRFKAVKGDIAHGALFEACCGGTEANVLACMHGLGDEVKYVTALPDSPLGKAAMEHLTCYGLDVSDIIVRGDTMGIYFVEDGDASRGTSVTYQRRFSEFTRLTESDLNFDRIFADADLFHISGISFALSDSSRRAAFRLVAEARSRGIPVSFDFNYRAKLWTAEQALPILAEAARNADILLAGSLDLNTFLQTDVEGVWRGYPLCKYLFLRDRKAMGDYHSVSIRAFCRCNGKTENFTLPETTFAVSEKIGGGDAFDGCLLHALLSGQSLSRATLFGAAGFILKHQQKGDTFDANADEIARFAATLNGYEN